jgi:hypothetical protein
MSALGTEDRRGSKGRVALHLSMALAMLAAGGGLARAEPGDAAEPGAAEAAGAAQVDDGGAAAPIPPEEEAAQRRRSVSPLDRRVMLLTRELGLNAGQQGRVRKVLEMQREEVARVWNDTSIPAARRVSATQAIGDRTAARIRALLTEEQRKRYIKPRRRDVAVGTAGGDTESWMSADRRR